jgi:hypothetical protein
VKTVTDYRVTVPEIFVLRTETFELEEYQFPGKPETFAHYKCQPIT